MFSIICQVTFVPGTLVGKMQISTEISGEECCKSINNTRLVSGCVQFSKIQQSECSHSACLTDSHQLIIWLKRCEQISVRFFCVVWEGDAYLPGKRRRSKWRPLQAGHVNKTLGLLSSLDGDAARVNWFACRFKRGFFGWKSANIDLSPSLCCDDNLCFCWNGIPGRLGDTWTFLFSSL